MKSDVGSFMADVISDIGVVATESPHVWKVAMLKFEKICFAFIRSGNV